ncbi:MAG: class I SAM-dependent methyltransferase [Sphingomonas sp.]|nr:class I SAM-dependent methyltransferase [Sphingomonas sp.]
MQHRLAIALATSTVLALTACQSAGIGPAVNQAAASAQRMATLQQAVAQAGRTPANVARDPYRHPAETLDFFEVDPNDTVVEIWPGGGWYTEILAPYLASGGGRLILGTLDGQLGGVTKLRDANPALYANVTSATFPAFDATAVRVPDGTADVVLTFRNVHNWKMGYRRDDKQDYSADAFRQIYAMLKPGGVLGIVDHRLPENASAERERTSGYIKASTVRQAAEAAGFRLAAESEINANPRDTADWADGVWTLPPALRLKDQDRARYLGIGESDRMTMKFVKPL